MPFTTPKIPTVEVNVETRGPENRFNTNLTLQFVDELLQLVDLRAPVVVWLNTDPWTQTHNTDTTAVNQSGVLEEF